MIQAKYFEILLQHYCFNQHYTKNFSDCESDITQNLVVVYKSMANSQTSQTPGKLTCDYLKGHIPKVSYDKPIQEERQKERIY